MQKIRVGKLTGTKSKTVKLSNTKSMAYAMMLLSKAYNIELFLFSKEDVDFENKTIRGLFFENDEHSGEINQIFKTVPIPPLIDAANHIVGEFLIELERYSRLVQPFRKPKKLRTYEKLKEDGRYAHLLIPTIPVANFDDIKKALAEHNGRLVLKSTGGSGGKSVLAIRRNADEFEFHKGNEVERLNETQAVEKVAQILSQTNYIAQPFIVSQTRFNEPCDLRIHCRRGKGGAFFVNIFPRIGSADGVVSNISSGGYAIDSKAFFKREFGETWKQKHDETLRFGKEFANYYQSLFPKKTTSNIGIDIGFMREGDEIKYYLFEVNTYMAPNMAMNNNFITVNPCDIINQLEYYRYLWNKHELGSVG